MSLKCGMTRCSMPLSMPKRKPLISSPRTLRLSFYPFDIKATTCTNLTKLIQKSFWEEDDAFNDGFQKFITNFQNLTAKAGILNKTTLIDHFSLGIDQQIAMMILSMSTIPTTLKEWIEKVITSHTQKMCIAAIRGRKGNSLFFTSRNSPSCDSNAMDVGTVTLTKLIPAKWACYIQEKLCMFQML